MRERKGSLSVQNSIQTRLSSVMALVMVFVVCINFFIFEQIHTGVDRIDAVFSSNAAINDLSDTLNKLEGTVYEYLNIKGTKALENYYRYEQDYRELLDKLNDRNVDNGRSCKSKRDISEKWGEGHDDDQCCEKCNLYKAKYL